MRNPLRLAALLSTLVLLSASTSSAQTIDFEDIQLAPESDLRGIVGEDGEFVSPTFIHSGGGQFVNEYEPWGWSFGFAVSNRTDNETPGFDPTVGEFGAVVNDSSAFAASGAGGSDNYAIGFGYVDGLDPTDAMQLQGLPNMVLPTGGSIVSAKFTNSTWAGISMRDGDAFGKVFGGSTGTDPDFFRLRVFGTDDGVPLEENVEFFLADFRFDEMADDFILKEWMELDLTALAQADRLYFGLDSSDNGTFGMNTPAYFAIDDIVFERTGDFDGDGEISVADINMLCAGVHTADASLELDLNGDGSVNGDDVAEMLTGTNRLPGDADFDGEVEFVDFLALADSFGQEAGWSDGDFNCNGVVQFDDFVTFAESFRAANQVAAASAPASVPEPSSAILAAMGILLLKRKDRSARC